MKVKIRLSRYRIGVYKPCKGEDIMMEHEHHEESHDSHHGGHGHEHMIDDFKRRFFVSLGLMIPILLLSDMIQEWLRF